MSLKVSAYVHGENQRFVKILAAAKFAGVAIEVDKDFQLGVHNETPEFLRNCHPLGRTPVLQTDEGYLFESNAILRYIGRLDKSNSFLYGRTNFEASQIDGWLDFAMGELDKYSIEFLATALFGKPQGAEYTAAVENITYALCKLDEYLENKTFLVGERLSLADISIAFALQWVFRFSSESEAWSKKNRNVWRLYNTVMQQPKTVEVLKEQNGSFGLVAKKKEDKPKAEEKPKAEAKPKKEAKPADDEDEEPAIVEEKKPNPLDLLPPSKFVLDAFKREYSNTDTRKVAAPFFFDNFDKEGFSCWYATYKYGSDLKMQFMTANLCRGWFQRMEHTRKYAFGVALIVGEEKSHNIISFWVFRGNALPDIVKEVEDTELFDWVPIADIAAERERITDFLCWEGPSFAATPVLEGRTFK